MSNRWRLLFLLGLGMALLGAIVLPSFVRSRASGQLTACKSSLKNIGTALEMYSTDFAGEYPRNIEQLRPNYLKTVPPNAQLPGGSPTAYPLAGALPEMPALVTRTTITSNAWVATTRD